MDKKIDLSIIIVSWNVKDLLREALKSLFGNEQNLEFEVIVIDNASNDGSAVMVEKEFPQVKLKANEKNRGFAKACNQGADLAMGEYLLFLNDDTVVFQETLKKCVDYFKSHEEVGVLGCSIKNADGTQQESVRSFPSLYNQLVILLKLHNFFPQLINKYIMRDFDYSKTCEVDQVMGAFFLTKKDIFNKQKGFDENYFIWYEEVDFCYQIKKSGLKVVYYSEAKIIHHGGASFKQLRALPEQMLLNRSMKYFFKKNKPRWQYWLIFLFAPVSLWLAAVVALLEKPNLNPKNKK